MIKKLIKAIKYHIKHNYLDGTTEKDLADESVLKEKDMIIARLTEENKDLRARNRELMKRK